MPEENKTITEDFFIDGRFVSKRLGDCIKEKYHFKTTTDNKEVYVYDNGVYIPEGESVIEKEVNDMLGDKFTTNRLNETISYIQTSTLTRRDGQPKNLINLTNGYYNTVTKKLEPHDPDIFSVVQLPFSYEPDLDCPKIKKFISDVVRPDDVRVMQEFFGYILHQDYFVQKAVMLLGDGQNGKSKFLGLVQAFVGKDNVSGVGLQDLEKRFTPARLYGKLANIYADLPDAALKYTGKFKMLTGGDVIDAEQKFKGFFTFVNCAKIIFSANKLPETTDDTDAFYRRWQFVSFPFTFTGEKRDPGILEKITTDEELSGLFNWALEGLARLKENGDFSESKSTEESRDHYIRMSSPVAAFVNDSLEFQADGIIPKDEMYSGYIEYCRKNGLPTLPSNSFALKLKQHFPNLATIRKGPKGNRNMCWVGVRGVKGVKAFSLSKTYMKNRKEIAENPDTLDTIDTFFPAIDFIEKWKNNGDPKNDMSADEIAERFGVTEEHIEKAKTEGHIFECSPGRFMLS